MLFVAPVVTAQHAELLTEHDAWAGHCNNYSQLSTATVRSDSINKRRFNVVSCNDFSQRCRYVCKNIVSLNHICTNALSSAKGDMQQHRLPFSYATVQRFLLLPYAFVAKHVAYSVIRHHFDVVSALAAC